jgi:hypothetical protein
VSDIRDLYLPVQFVFQKGHIPLLFALKYLGRRSLKVSRDEIVRSSASANINLGGGRTYFIAVRIKGAEKTQLIEADIELNLRQRVLIYKKRGFNRAIMPPESHGTPRSII